MTPEPTYSFTLTETERAAFAKVLGGLVTKLLNAPVQIDERDVAPLPLGVNKNREYPSESFSPARPADPTSGTDHARAILSPPAAAQPAPPTPPIALRDRWARDRKGYELPNPSGCEAITAHIWKQERRDTSGRARLKVSWQAPGGKGFVDAACWDEKLFPWIAAQSKEPTALLYVVKSGKYLNVVGVRA